MASVGAGFMAQVTRQTSFLSPTEPHLELLVMVGQLQGIFTGAAWCKVIVFFLEAFLESFLAVFAEHVRFTFLVVRAGDHGSSWLRFRACVSFGN